MDSPTTTEELKEGLFENEFVRQGLVAHIRGYAIDLVPSQELFLERFPQSRRLGTVFFPFLSDEDLLGLDLDLLPPAAALFIPTEELEGKREPALDWLRGVSAWDVGCALIAYTLTDDRRDFATLERVWPDWVPDAARPGDKIHYHGIAHPFPGARGICLRIYHERFVIEDMIIEEGERWYGIRNRDRNETLWITETLLVGSATFDRMPVRSFEHYPTPIEIAVA